MSTAYSSAKQQYIGNGVTTEWGFDFPIQKHSELKVYLKRSGRLQVLLEEGIDYSFVTENTIVFPIKVGEPKLQAADVLALQRESVFESEYNFSNQRRLEPEEVMNADDNLERQVQELKRDVSQAIRIQPTSNINTDEYFVAVESIYEHLDDINNVSGISAEIVNCSDNIEEVVAVSSNIANVNTVGNSISSVNTVASNVSDVNTVAGVATDVTTVASVADSVPTVANNSANVATVADNISDVNTAASNMTAIQAAPTAASNAANSAIDSANSAIDSANSAIDSANSANASAVSAQAAQDALDEVHGLLAIPIGTIFQSIYVDESLDIARQLNGQLISSTKFTGFRDWLDTVQTAIPNLFTDEATWQAEKLLSKFGQVGKFVIDDTAGTIRLPAVVNTQGLLSLSGIGNLVNESLPTAVALVGYNGVSGEFRQKVANYTYTSDSHQGNTSAPMSSETTSGSQVDYLNDKPVQQEAVQYPYYIQVATGIEETLPAIREYKTNVPYVLGDSKYFEANPYNASWLESNGQYNASSVYPDFWTQLTGVELNTSLDVGDTIEIGGKSYVKRGLPVVLSTGTITDYDFVVNQNDQTFRLPLKTKLASGSAVAGNGSVVGLTGYVEGGSSKYEGALGRKDDDSRLIDLINNSSGGTELKSANIGVIGTVQTTWGVKGVGISEAPEKSGIETSSNGLKLYYYVGDTVQDASLINAGAVLGQLSDKISRTSSSDKELVVGWMGIDTSSGIARALNTTYTATRNCWIFHNENANNNGSFYINDVLVYQTSWHSGLTFAKGSALVFVAQGQRWYATGGASVTEFGTIGG